MNKDIMNTKIGYLLKFSLNAWIACGTNEDLCLLVNATGNRILPLRSITDWTKSLCNGCSSACQMNMEQTQCKQIWSTYEKHKTMFAKLAIVIWWHYRRDSTPCDGRGSKSRIQLWFLMREETEHFCLPKEQIIYYVSQWNENHGHWDGFRNRGI
jgi:hypothetical protein